jgi:hypothetical protein
MCRKTDKNNGKYSLFKEEKQQPPKETFAFLQPPLPPPKVIPTLPLPPSPAPEKASLKRDAVPHSSSGSSPPAKKKQTSTLPSLPQLQRLPSLPSPSSEEEVETILQEEEKEEEENREVVMDMEADDANGPLQFYFVDAFEEPYKRPGMHLHFVVFFFDKKIFSE